MKWAEWRPTFPWNDQPLKVKCNSCKNNNNNFYNNNEISHPRNRMASNPICTIPMILIYGIYIPATFHSITIPLKREKNTPLSTTAINLPTNQNTARPNTTTGSRIHLHNQVPAFPPLQSTPSKNNLHGQQRN